MWLVVTLMCMIRFRGLRPYACHFGDHPLQSTMSAIGSLLLINCALSPNPTWLLFCLLMLNNIAVAFNFDGEHQFSNRTQSIHLLKFGYTSTGVTSERTVSCHINDFTLLICFHKLHLFFFWIDTQVDVNEWKLWDMQLVLQAQGIHICKLH